MRDQYAKMPIGMVRGVASRPSELATLAWVDYSFNNKPLRGPIGDFQLGGSRASLRSEV
ncbi:MAG: hypothetical protein VB140_05460 [Burkholderia sp.]